MAARIDRLDPATDLAEGLLKQSDDYMAGLYPAESNHLESAADLQRPNVVFLGAWIGDQLAGCGAVKIMNIEPLGYSEIKRLYVLPDCRCQGVSTALMDQHKKTRYHVGPPGGWHSAAGSSASLS